MRHLLLFENFRVPTELADLARGLGYDEFVDHGKLSDYTVLYRGMTEGDELDDDQFYAEWSGHAREYGEWVDGVVADYKDIMHSGLVVSMRFSHSPATSTMMRTRRRY